MTERRRVYVLKIWLEPHGADAEDGPPWRGSLQPVGSSLTRYFSSLEKLPELVRQLQHDCVPDEPI